MALAILTLLCLPAAPVSAETTAEVGFVPEVQQVGAGDIAAIAVEVRDVSSLYGVDVEIRFDPTVIDIVDADPDMSGVQLALGDFLDAGFALAYEADNTAGTARLTLTQVSPSTPKSGTGVLCTLLVRGGLAGQAGALVIERADLATADGERIPVHVKEGRVEIVAMAQAPPTPTTAPVVRPTLIVTPELVAALTSDDPSAAETLAGTTSESVPAALAEVAGSTPVAASMHDTSAAGERATPVAMTQPAMEKEGPRWLVLGLVVVAIAGSVLPLVMPKERSGKEH